MPKHAGGNTPCEAVFTDPWKAVPYIRKAQYIGGKWSASVWKGCPPFKLNDRTKYETPMLALASHLEGVREAGMLDQYIEDLKEPTPKSKKTRDRKRGLHDNKVLWTKSDLTRLRDACELDPEVTPMNLSKEKGAWPVVIDREVVTKWWGPPTVTGSSLQHPSVPFSERVWSGVGGGRQVGTSRGACGAACALREVGGDRAWRAREACGWAREARRAGRGRRSAVQDIPGRVWSGVSLSLSLSPSLPPSPFHVHILTPTFCVTDHVAQADVMMQMMGIPIHNIKLSAEAYLGRDFYRVHAISFVD